MKPTLLAALLTILAVLPGLAGTTRLTGNKSVAVEIAVKDAPLAAGAAGEVTISFKPVDGIHINLQPALDFKLDSASMATLSGGLVLPKGAPYLNTSAPVVQRFQLSKNAKPGPITLKGMLTYFYCSDKEGWCSKFRQPVEVALTVRR